MTDMSHDPQAHDTLAALLRDAAPPVTPARDTAFMLDVMQKVERRRLIERLAYLAVLTAFSGVVLFLIMPYVTPVLSSIAVALAPICAVLVALGLAWYAFDQVNTSAGFTLPSLRRK